MLQLMIATALVVLCSATYAYCLDATVTRQLNALAPRERQEQRCDIEAMTKIAAMDPQFDPDKVIAYTFGDPKTNAGSLRAPGAVFRSKGSWYRLRYLCQTQPGGLTVTRFHFKIGAIVPRSQWRRYYLYR